jgi:hypothetical protein
MIVSYEKASLHELETVYSVEDIHDMIEVLLVDLENNRRIDAFLERRRRDSG